MINISQWSDYWCRSLKPFIINNLYYTSSIESVCPAMTLYWTEIWAALTSKSSPFLSFSKIIHKYILITQKTVTHSCLAYLSQERPVPRSAPMEQRQSERGARWQRSIDYLVITNYLPITETCAEIPRQKHLSTKWVIAWS